MNKINVRVKYINHSCFTVEVGNRILVFDYFKGDIDFGNKDIYVFASHNHWDHFDPKVMEWNKSYENIHYILSNDIQVEKGKNITFIGPYKETFINDISIKTFGSTDKGVSFLVSVDGVNIFHAGDLNWWYWDEDSEDEKIDMENSFKIKIKRIKESGKDIDIGFFPVDPRLEENFHLGGEYFIDQIKPKYFFPMHLWDKYSFIQKFIHKTDSVSTIVVDIRHKNQVFEL